MRRVWINIAPTLKIGSRGTCYYFLHHEGTRVIPNSPKKKALTRYWTLVDSYVALVIFVVTGPVRAVVTSIGFSSVLCQGRCSGIWRRFASQCRRICSAPTPPCISHSTTYHLSARLFPVSPVSAQPGERRSFVFTCNRQYHVDHCLVYGTRAVQI